MISKSQSNAGPVSPWFETSRLRVPSVYLLKSEFQHVLRPLVSMFAQFGISANQVTIFAAALSVLFGLSLALQSQAHILWLIVPFILFVRMALNAMDGMLARDFSQKSDLGVYLNELGDVISDVFLYFPFACLPGIDLIWMLALILLTVISEMAGQLAVMVGAGRRYDGPMGKSDRAAIFGGLGLWLGLSGALPAWTLYWFPRIMCALLVATLVRRVQAGLATKEGRND